MRSNGGRKVLGKRKKEKTRANHLFPSTSIITTRHKQHHEHNHLVRLQLQRRPRQTATEEFHGEAERVHRYQQRHEEQPKVPTAPHENTVRAGQERAVAEHTVQPRTQRDRPGVLRDHLDVRRQDSDRSRQALERVVWEDLLQIENPRHGNLSSEHSRVHGRPVPPVVPHQSALRAPGSESLPSQQGRERQRDLEGRGLERHLTRKLRRPDRRVHRRMVRVEKVVWGEFRCQAHPA